jgi:hypothetical protein
MSNSARGSAYDHKVLLDGVHAFVLSIRDGGQEIIVTGWDNEHRRYEPGQKALLVDKDGTETRYEFLSVRSMSDPQDQYFARLKFSPRQDISQQTENNRSYTMIKHINDCLGWAIVPALLSVFIIFLAKALV